MHASNTYPVMKATRGTEEAENGERRASNGLAVPDVLDPSELRPYAEVVRKKRFLNSSPRVSECSSVGSVGSDNETVNRAKKPTTSTTTRRPDNGVINPETSKYVVDGIDKERESFEKTSRLETSDVTISGHVVDGNEVLLETIANALPQADGSVVVKETDRWVDNDVSLESHDLNGVAELDESYNASESPGTNKKSKSKPRRRRFKKNKSKAESSPVEIVDNSVPTDDVAPT